MIFHVPAWENFWSTTLIRLVSTPLFGDKIYTESGQMKKYFFKL